MTHRQTVELSAVTHHRSSIVTKLENIHTVEHEKKRKRHQGHTRHTLPTVRERMFR